MPNTSVRAIKNVKNVVFKLQPCRFVVCWALLPNLQPLAAWFNADHNARQAQKYKYIVRRSDKKHGLFVNGAGGKSRQVMLPPFLFT